MKNWLEDDQTYIMNTYNRLPVVIERGEKNYLFDIEGKKYLDLFTGLGVSIVGHQHPALLETLSTQASHVLHLCNHFPHKPEIELAKKLSHIAFNGEGQVFFANSGTEATESCIKLVHRYMESQQKENRGIVVFSDGYHGRTLGALHLTRQPHVYQTFPSPSFPIFEVERENVEQLEEVLKTHRPSAVLFEPVLGSGGVRPLSDTFMLSIEKLCRTYDALLCIDEIQTGVGRTGTFFAFQALNMNPDIVLFGKSIGGGLPLGGIIAKRKIAKVFKPGDHGTTFGGNPAATSLGNTMLRLLLDEGLMEQSKVTSSYLQSGLQKIQSMHSEHIEEIRSKGMMFGIQSTFSKEKCKDIQQAMMKNGFLIDVTQGNIFRLLPPLTLQEDEIESFLYAFEKSIFEASIH